MCAPDFLGWTSHYDEIAQIETAAAEAERMRQQHGLSRAELLKRSSSATAVAWLLEPCVRACLISLHGSRSHATIGAMSFNLDPPPGFRGLDPDCPITIYTRNLPHWRQPGATYFVIFHLADALPLAKRNELASMQREWELRHGPPRSEAAWTEFAKTIFRTVERWMDAGHGDCWFRKPNVQMS